MTGWKTVLDVVTALGQVMLNLSLGPDMYTIYRRKSIGEMPALPQSSMLVNCHVWMCYGILRDSIFPVAVSQGIGQLAAVVFNLIYFHYSPPQTRKETSKLYKVAIVLHCVVTLFFVLSLAGVTGKSNYDSSTFLGYFGVFINVCMFASPFATLKHVVKTKSAASIPINLSLMIFASSVLWVVTGLLDSDYFITGLNLAGAKRLKRIEENRKKLQELRLSVIGSPSDVKPEQKPVKRERIYEEEAPAPTRMSIRQRMKQRREAEKDEEVLKEYRRESRRIAKENRERAKLKSRQRYIDKKLEIQVLAEERKQRVAERLQQMDEAAEKEPRIQDWRLRRRRQAQLERRKETVKRREEEKDKRKLEREKKDAARKAWRASERLHKKRRKKRERFALNIQKEIDKQQRYEERQLMAAEDHQARKWEKEQKKDEKHERNILRGLRVEELAVERELLKSKAKEEKEEALFKKMYPVRRVKDLPFVRISDAREIDEAKPLVMTPLLKTDPNSFHAFSLGKQFLPPGKGSVMQGVCPGGYTAAFNEELDIHMWKNAMTLFMNGSSGIYYHFKFQEERHDGRKSVFFRWLHTRNVTPEILERLRRVQKGDEILCFDDETYYSAPAPTNTRPEPLLLFVQYPMGPYIYLGRLGYLGHRSDPLEFSFQLLDVNVLNWKKIHKAITCETT